MIHAYLLFVFMLYMPNQYLKIVKDVSLLIRLVDKINSSIGQDPNSKQLIGVLDIYGFESFKFNR